MATKTASKKTTAKTTDIKETIIRNYREKVLLNGHPPASVFQFMHEMKKDEGLFYDHFASFEALEKHIWKNYAQETTEVLQKDKSFTTYSTREKMLAFYFTLFERLKNDRSFVRYSFNQIRQPDVKPSVLQKFREEFIDFVSNVLNEGRENEEIVDRPVISDRYQDGIWLQMMFLLRFWLKDDSAGFTNTDAAVEKSVNLSFELMGRGPLDQMIDFAKFLYHNR